MTRRMPGSVDGRARHVTCSRDQGAGVPRTIPTTYTAGKFSRRRRPTQMVGDVVPRFLGHVVVVAVWCKNCRQEVPAVCDGADDEPRCVRCGAAMSQGARGPQGPAAAARSRAARVTLSHANRQRGPRQASASFVGDAPTVTIRAPLSTFDTWELEEQLRHVDRILSGAPLFDRGGRSGRGAPSKRPNCAAKSAIAWCVSNGRASCPHARGLGRRGRRRSITCRGHRIIVRGHIARTVHLAKRRPADHLVGPGGTSVGNDDAVGSGLEG